MADRVGNGTAHRVIELSLVDGFAAVLGEEEIKATKKFYGWPEDQHFWGPPEG